MSEPFKPFSKRHGYTQTDLPQREGLDEAVRTGLWNAFYANFPDIDEWDNWHDHPIACHSHPVHKEIFVRFLKKAIDEYEDDCVENKRYIKAFFLNQEWNEVLDLVDFVMHADYKQAFVDGCNMALAQENSAYRIVGNSVVEITSEQEVAEIEAALKIPFDSARGHLEKALALLSDRENPDYENSIKESISAVESVAREATGDSKATLGQLADSIDLHPAFQEGLKKLYGFTSDAGGIRHADDSSKPGKYLKPNQATARFMLVTCSAFVNYIIAGSPE